MKVVNNNIHKILFFFTYLFEKKIRVKEHLLMKMFASVWVDILEPVEFCRFECKKGHFLRNLWEIRHFFDFRILGDGFSV